MSLVGLGTWNEIRWPGVSVLDEECVKLTMTHLPCRFLMSTFAGAAMMSEVSPYIQLVLFLLISIYEAITMKLSRGAGEMWVKSF
jgi:hypothetical protein